MFLTVEPLLVSRLKAACPSARVVLTAADLAGVKEAAQVTPAVQVYFDGLKVEETTACGERTRFSERWLVVVVVKHARQGREGAAAIRAGAAQLLAEVFAALSGYQPGSGLSYLVAETPPPPVFGDAHAYIPLAFSTRYTVKGIED